MRDFMLTTTDNKYNYFTQFDDWFGYDQMMGYNTLELLATYARTSSELSDYENEQSINAAIIEIVKLNPLGIHTICEEPEGTSPIDY